MFMRLGRLVHDRRRLVIAAALLFAALAAVLGPAVQDEVSSGGFVDPDAESARAAAVLEEAFGPRTDDVVAVWRHPTLDADDPAFGAALATVLADVPADEVERIVHPWLPGLPDDVRAGLVGADGRSAMAAIALAGDDDDARAGSYERVRDTLVAPAPFTTHLAGSQPVLLELQERAERDIARAEMLAMPVLLVLLVVIFGSLAAAALPVVIGVVAIVGSMLVLRGVTAVTDVSPFALNVATILGLGLAIDYSLFVVSRFREEVARAGVHGDGSPDVAVAVRRTVATAGRTVAFSGLTVAIAFCGLLFFPQMFMRSMGLGGIAVVVVDVVLALTLLPALLAWLGPRVDAGRLPAGLTRRLHRSHGDPGEGGWARLARGVLARPVPVVVGATTLLALVALPATHLVAGETDVRDLPTGSTARQDAEVLGDLFPAAAATTVDVVVVGEVEPGDLAAYVASLRDLPGAAAVEAAAATEGVTHIRVRTDGGTEDARTRALVADLRDDEHAGAGTGLGPGVEVLVGGGATAGMDAVAAITRVLPWTLLFVAGVTMLLLFLALRSVVLPLKAVVMNALSLAATVGLVTWGFVEGHLAGPLGFTGAGRVEAANLVLIGLIALGLAMDYELFLLSRVREERLRGADDTTAIAVGLQRSGRTITSAALLLVVVLLAMVTSGVTFLKTIGLGLAFAVALDATVVRALLVPATMRLLGRANWWLPGPLARVHARLGFEESGADGSPDGPEALPDADRRELVGAR